MGVTQKQGERECAGCNVVLSAKQLKKHWLCPDCYTVMERALFETDWQKERKEGLDHETHARRLP